MIYELMFKECPWEERTIEALKKAIKHKPLRFNDRKLKLTNETKELFKRVLVADPKKRITWEELFNYDMGYLCKYFPNSIYIAKLGICSTTPPESEPEFEDYATHDFGGFPSATP